MGLLKSFIFAMIYLPVSMVFLVLFCVKPSIALDFCGETEQKFTFGLSVYSSARDWIVDAHKNHNVQWKFGYIYTLPNHDNNPDYYTWFIKPRTETITKAGALPVYTFYQLLKIGQHAGLTGSHEADIVKKVLQNASLMHQYFDNLIKLLSYTKTITSKAVIHIEPDSWGFMWWAMGIEGNGNANSIAVKVAASGHPDVTGFANTAAGFAKALLALRDKYAPNFYMAFHASNFRVGTRPEVVVNFLRDCGRWDLLVTEHPHNEPDASMWWNPWDNNRVSTNLNWAKTITEALRLPMLLWQTPIGSTDYHMLGNSNDLSMLKRFSQSGIVGVLFEHQNFNGSSHPDYFRASGAYGNVPPSGSSAGGTAKRMRERLALYSSNPLQLVGESSCSSTQLTPLFLLLQGE
jgi:hypothetical protein